MGKVGSALGTPTVPLDSHPRAQFTNLFARIYKSRFSFCHVMPRGTRCNDSGMKHVVETARCATFM